MKIDVDLNGMLCSRGVEDILQKKALQATLLLKHPSEQ
jgi:hypothetical protein